MKLMRYTTPTLPNWPSFDRMASLRDLLESAFALAGSRSTENWEGSWAPALDVYEDAEKITVKVELAGLKKEDFDISLQDDLLTISGERKVDAGAKEGESFRSERYFGQFSRTIALPARVDGDKVAASYRDGVLTVELPKSDAAKPRKIDVKLN